MKTTSKMDVPSAKGAEEHSQLFQAARRVLLAGIGAVSLAQDEMEDFINKLVERGEIAEKDGRSLASEMRERRSKHLQKVEDEISKRVEKILERMDVPRKGDIDALSDKISALAKKLDKLEKGQE